MADEKKNVETDAQTDDAQTGEAPAPMNRAERRAAAHHKKPATGHPTFGSPFGSTGSFHAGSPSAPHRKGAVHRKTGD